jgi:drug/metabolite transporter (DMT)-like permease
MESVQSVRLPAQRAESLPIGIWLVAFAASLWGTDAVFRMQLVKHLTSTQIVLCEHLLLAFYAVPVAWMARRQLKALTRSDWFAILFISWGGSGLATILFTMAFQYGNPTAVLLLQKLQPIFAILMSRWVLKEAVPSKFFSYLPIAVVGAYLLSFGFTLPFDPNGGVEKLMGSLLAIGSAVLWGGSTVMGRKLLGRMEFSTTTAVRFLFALPFLGALVMFTGPSWQGFETASWTVTLLPILLLALVPGLISLLLYYRGLSSTKASYATLAELAFPATGVLLNWYFLHEGLNMGQLIGFAVVWLVVYQLSRLRS